MKRIIHFCFLAVFSLFILTASSLFSEEAYWSKLKFELSTAVSLEKSLLDTSYFHQYSPPFLSGSYQSSAQQTIFVKGKEGKGLNVAFAYFPLEKLGIQLQVEYGRLLISSKNSPYQVHLNYALGLFPGPPPYPNTYEPSFGWPATEGNLTELCLSLNALTRLPIVKRVAISFSGGLTYFRAEGEGSGLAYGKYWIEDNYFMGETYQIKFAFGPANKLGFNVGAELNWVLISTICFVTDVRFYSCTASKLPLKIIDEGLVADPFDQVKATMNLGEIKINPSFYRINFGLKYLF